MIRITTALISTVFAAGALHAEQQYIAADPLRLPTPILAYAFEKTAPTVDLNAKYIDPPALAPTPGKQPDIRAKFGPLSPDLPTLARSETFSPVTQSVIERYCTPIRGCNLRDDGGLVLLRDMIEQAGLPRPENFAHKFYAPNHVSTFLDDGAAEVYCEIDNFYSLYIFDDLFELHALRLVWLNKIWPKTEPEDHVVTGCDMAPDGRLFISIAESYLSGSDGAVFAFAPNLDELLWVSPHNTSNAGVHLVGDRLFSAHGGTGIPDYLFELDPTTGQVIGRKKTQTGVDMILSDGNRLILSGYDFAQIVTLD